MKASFSIQLQAEKHRNCVENEGFLFFVFWFPELCRLGSIGQSDCSTVRQIDQSTVQLSSCGCPSCSAVRLFGHSDFLEMIFFDSNRMTRDKKKKKTFKNEKKLLFSGLELN
jgi:hypothetical protein